MPLIILNPQPEHTPCSLNFRVILIFRQLPSAYSIVSALLHPRLGRSALLLYPSTLFLSRLVLALWLYHTNALAGISCLRTTEGVDDHVEYRQCINNDLRVVFNS